MCAGGGGGDVASPALANGHPRCCHIWAHPDPQPATLQAPKPLVFTVHAARTHRAIDLQYLDSYGRPGPAGRHSSGHRPWTGGRARWCAMPNSPVPPHPTRLPSKRRLLLALPVARCPARPSSSRFQRQFSVTKTLRVEQQQLRRQPGSTRLRVQRHRGTYVH
jgi:hypothetical protein